MKKNLICILLNILISSIYIVAVTGQQANSIDHTGVCYSENKENKLLEEFKVIFYDRQKNIMGNMSQDEHDKFIQSYLENAAKTLHAFQYCMKNPRSQACASYKDTMWDFYKYVLKDSASPKQYEARKAVLMMDVMMNKLADSIQKVKEESKQEFDALKEFANTDHLFGVMAGVYYAGIDRSTFTRYRK